MTFDYDLLTEKIIQKLDQTKIEESISPSLHEFYTPNLKLLALNFTQAIMSEAVRCDTPDLAYIEASAISMVKSIYDFLKEENEKGN